MTASELSLLDNRVMWTPKDPGSTKMEEFRRYVNDKHSLTLADYDALYKWSIDNIAAFWEDVWQFTGMVASVPYTSVVDERAHPADLPKWFEGARLNFAENLLQCNDDRVAIYATGEGHGVDRVTFRDLRERVRRCAAAMRAMGITVGDRVGGYIANCTEAVVAMLAATSIGAVWSSTSPDFGVKGVLERFSQIEPRIIFSVNAVHYNGRVHSHMGKLAEVVNSLPSVERVVIVPFVEEEPTDLSLIRNGVLYADFEATGRAADGSYPELVFEQLPFNHPGFILFSSGTTGHPKCIVHSAAGPLLQHKKEHIIHGDMRPSDILFQYTTAGWMMWNWLVSALSVGAAIVLFDGSPFKPDPNRLFKLVDEIGITLFGASAKYVAALEENNVRPREHAKLSTLRAFYSTGSPLKPESYDYVYTHVSPDLCLGSITGGTDIVSLFAGANMALPVHRGEIQCRNLGMAMESWTEDGRSVEGERGDLVCKRPFPCQPVFFWNDADGEKYRRAYFANFPGVWYHGDFVVINPATGGVIMLGRSDGTLNPGGVRIGTAELYNLVEGYKEVADCLVVGQPWRDDERVVMFLKMNEGSPFTADLVERIKKHIRAELSPRHVPSFILPIADIPYTINGKKVEVAVKRILAGETVVPSGAIGNPDALKLFYNIPELSQ